MMLCANSYIEYIIACLLTHAPVLEQVIQNPLSIKKYFRLSLLEENYLSCFLSCNQRRFLATAALAEEKRYRELRLVLKYVSCFVTDSQLQSYWKNYVLSLSLHQLPQTPLEESLYFLNYLLCMGEHPVVLHNIIQYELLLNTLLKQHENADPIVRHPVVFDETVFCTWPIMISRMMLHPALLKHKFSIAISTVIMHLKNNLTFVEGKTENIYKTESCLFVFNHHTFTTRVMVIQDILNAILKFLSQPVYLIDLVDFIRRDLHCSASRCLRYLNHLLTNHIIVFAS